MRLDCEPPITDRQLAAYRLQTGASVTAAGRYFYGVLQPQALGMERAFAAKAAKILSQAKRLPFQQPRSAAPRPRWDRFPLLLLSLPHIPIFRQPLLPANVSHIKRGALPHPLRTPHDSESFLRDSFLRHCARGARDTQSPAARRPRPPSVAYRCGASASAFKSYFSNLHSVPGQPPCFV
jgi:hypothetical protein